MSGEIASRIASKMIQARKGKGLTQEQIAEYLNVKSTTYANWEQCRAEPSIDTIYALCTFYDESFDEWLGLRPSYTEAAYGGKLLELPEEERQEIEDYIEFRHQKWLKEHGEN